MSVKKKVDWAAYDLALQNRGSINVWLSDAAIEQWNALPTGQRGAQPKYSDLAIETSLSIRLVFKQPLRQAEGMLRSLFEIMSVNLEVPDHSTLSRRCKTLTVSSSAIPSTNEHLDIVIDSTGLKIYGAGEWSETKHGLKKRRQWRKLHLSIEASTLEIVEASLTDNDVGDSTEALNHINNIDAPIDSFMGDGAYDSDAIYKSVEEHDDKVDPSVIIPPRKNAVLSGVADQDPTQRDRHIDFIHRHGRSAWEIENNYSKRLLVENAMGRFKGIIGSVLRARLLASQITEALLGCRILNKMTALGVPSALMIE